MGGGELGDIIMERIQAEAEQKENQDKDGQIEEQTGKKWKLQKCLKD